jgi:hypothetical protein
MAVLLYKSSLLRAFIFLSNLNAFISIVILICTAYELEYTQNTFASTHDY